MMLSTMRVAEAKQKTPISRVLSTMLRWNASARYDVISQQLQKFEYSERVLENFKIFF